MGVQRMRVEKGIVRTSELQAKGVSKHAIAKAVKAGELERLARGWVATPDADPQLKHAASSGLTVTCVSQAMRLGLWVRVSDERHFAVPRPGCEVRGQHDRIHYWKSVEVRTKYALEDSLGNVLSNIARCQPFEDAVSVWDSALNKRLIGRGYLESLSLGKRAREVLAATSEFADSGLETFFRLRMHWLRVPLRSQTWLHGRRVDFLLGDRLVVQIDGGSHVGAQRDADNAHDAVLAASGYTVLRFGYAQVIHEWPAVQDAVMRAISARLHTRR